MKHLAILLLSLFAFSAFAQNTLIVHLKDGQTFGYGFNEKPVVSCSNPDIVITTTSTQILFPLEQVAKFTFADGKDDTSVKSKISVEANFSIGEGSVRIIGSVPNESFFISTADGKAIASFKADANGNLTFSTTEYAKGIYIIKSKSLTCKILKR